jgi:hypothetical protein
MKNKLPLDGFPWKDAAQFSKDFKAAKVFFTNNPSKNTMPITEGPTSVEFFKHPKCNKILAIGESRKFGRLICTDSGRIMQRGFPWINEKERAKAFAAAEAFFQKYPYLDKIKRNNDDPFSVSFIKKGQAILA